MNDSPSSRITLRRTSALVAGSFFLVLMGVVATAFISRHYAAAGAASTQALIGRHLPNLATVGNIERATLRSEAALFQFAMAGDEGKMAALADSFKADLGQVRTEAARLGEAIDAPAVRNQLVALSDALGVYDQVASRFQTSLRAGDFEAAMATLDRDVAAARSQVIGSLADLTTGLADESAAASQATADSIARSTRIGTLTGTALSICTIAGMLIAVFSVRAVSRQVQRTGDTLTDAAGIVRERAAVLVDASQALADGSSQQAASLEESSASLEEMAGMTRNNADSAGRAEEVARQTRRAADTGAARMKEMDTAMGAIMKACEDVTAILKTIDEIAFQTNILALNAAVEAARAGEAGAGFAVVADEVRSLAQRSARAAKETAEKIEVSVKRSREGVSLSADVAKNFDDIQKQIRTLADLVAGQASSASEQSQGIDQLNLTVSQMDQVTQSNAANAEETAAAAADLNQQSAILQNAVEHLRLLIGQRTAGQHPAASPGRAAPSDRNPIEDSQPSLVA